MLIQFATVVFTAFTLGACASSPTASEVRSTWVWIQTGPRDAEVIGDERNAAFAGHFSNMARMAENGDLLVAGPLGQAGHRPEHRGVFVLRTDETAKALDIAGTDPSAVAGIFKFEIEPFATADGLHRLTAWHSAALEALGTPNPPPGTHCRPYVLAEGRPLHGALKLAKAPGVLFCGRIGAGTDQRLLICLDAQDEDQARSLLEDSELEDSGEVQWDMIPWFGTEEITRLRGGDPLGRPR